MPVVLDLVCRHCSAEHPRTVMRGKLSDARCTSCSQRALRASWKRGAAPCASVFQAVMLLDGTEIKSPEELAVRTAKVMRGEDPDTRIVFNDDKAARKIHIDELRHDTWARRQAHGIDASVMREAEELGRHVKPGERSPSALDIAKINRYGTTDPEPTAIKELGAESRADWDVVCGIAEHDHGGPE